MIDIKVQTNQDGSFITSFVHPLNEKVIRKAFTSQKKFEIYQKEMMGSYNLNMDYNQMTISKLILLYNKEVKANPFTRGKGNHLDFIEVFGDFKVSEINSINLKAWLDQIQKESALQEITMRGIKNRIDRFLNFLVRKEIISTNPSKEIYYQKSAPTISSRNILSPQEIDKLLAAIKKFSPGYLYPIIKMMSETAAKNKEVVELNWNDVDLEKKMVHFRETQASQKRTLKISDELTDLLKLKPKRKGQLFLTYYNHPFTSKILSRLVKEFKAKKLFTKEWSPMDLRHSFAVNFLSNGGTLKELQKILGHLLLYDTKRLYGEVVNKTITKGVSTPI